MKFTLGNKFQSMKSIQFHLDLNKSVNFFEKDEAYVFTWIYK